VTINVFENVSCHSFEGWEYPWKHPSHDCLRNLPEFDPNISQMGSVSLSAVLILPLETHTYNDFNISVAHGRFTFINCTVYKRQFLHIQLQITFNTALSTIAPA
jgi:hypothetical protein